MGSHLIDGSVIWEESESYSEGMRNFAFMLVGIDDDDDDSP